MKDNDIDNNDNNDNNDEKIVKIVNTYLEETNQMNILTFFGDWIYNTENLKKQFINAEPFEHIIIDNFLNNEYANKVHELFPINYEDWHKYENPIEVKYTYDNINILPTELKNYFYYLSSKQIIDLFRRITNIDNLNYDEYLHGAGLHCHPRNGRLNIHLDYEKHPYSGKERRLNVILFLSKEWEDEWNGFNQLWDKEVTKCVKKTKPVFNRAIIFKTNDISWHGLPEKIMCPENVYRKSLAYYYVSPLNSLKHENAYRKKAKYVKTPEEPYNENMEELYKIRVNRRIVRDDITKYFPNWTIFS
jgi:Rps23 Pro-64 3,4-dihydroxylase Tpa1-like proline 4-hydroxylase